MPDFSYKAAQANGQTTTGLISAESREHAIRLLRGQGLTPLDLNEATEAATLAHEQRARRKGWGSKNRITHDDLLAMTNELAVMYRAGLPLDRALRVMKDMAPKPVIADLVEDLLNAVKGGKALSQALLPYHSVFGDFYINMVKSGEAGGSMEEVLNRLAEHLDRMKTLRDSVVSALVYPAILVLVALIAVVFLLLVVVPKFEPMFKGLGAGLPIPTQIILAAGHLLRNQWWLIALVSVSLIFLGRTWLASPAGQRWKDKRMLTLPILGQIMTKFEITRFSRSLGTLLGSGVPIVTAIKIASETIGNRFLRQAMETVNPEIKRGGRLAEALVQTKLFTPLALNMVRLGEETGRLDGMLLELARIYDSEVQSSIKRGLTLLEPILIVGLGIGIGGIIASLLLGIISVNSLVGR